MPRELIYVLFLLGIKFDRQKITRVKTSLH
jgi:hypothetical protein